MKLLQRGNGGKKEWPPSLWERDPFESLHRLMETFGRPAFWPVSIAPDAVDLRGGFVPRLDAVEDDKEVRLTAELPGLEEKDVQVSLAKDVLTIQGEKKTEKEETKKDCAFAERSYGSFKRVIAVPETVDAAKIHAVMKNGVLTVTLSKKPEAAAEVRKIEVKKE